MDEPTYHPDHATLERYSHGELSSAEEARIEEHLRSGCTRCQRKVDDLLLGMEKTLRDTLPLRVDAGWDRLFASFGQRLSLARRERETAPQLVTELLAAPEAGRDDLIRTRPQLLNPAVCDLLLERSFGQGFEEPAQAVELASLAVRIAEQLDPRFYGRSLVQDLRTRSWAHLGNARRLTSDFPGAEQALTIAQSHLEGGSTDPLEEARVLDFKASLLSDRGWFEEAADLVDVVIEIYREIRDTHRQGRAEISKGVFLGYAGRASAAVELISAGLARIDRDQEPRLVLVAHHNLAWFLNDCGRSAEAFDLLESFRTTYGEFQDPWTRNRLIWLEGRIAFGLGWHQEAEAALSRARKSFLAQGLGYEASMVTLDLAGFYLHQGRTAEVKSLAREMLPHFLSQDIHRQAVVALATFQRAAEMDRVTPHLVRDVAAYLMRAQRNPGLRFQ